MRARVFLSVRQAAKRLGSCDQQVYGLCRDGRLAHYRIGAAGKRGKIVIAEEDLEAYLESVRVASRDPPANTPVVLRHLKLNDAPRGDSRG
jgi:excisionase family DNA binding protein